MYVTCTVLRHRPRMASPARFGNRCCANRWSLNRMGSRPCHEPFFVMNDRFVRRSILRRRFLFSWLLGDFGIVWRYYGEHGDLSVRLPVRCGTSPCWFCARHQQLCNASTSTCVQEAFYTYKKLCWSQRTAKRQSRRCVSAAMHSTR